MLLRRFLTEKTSTFSYPQKNFVNTQAGDFLQIILIKPPTKYTLLLDPKTNHQTQNVYFDESTGVTSLLLPRVAEGTTFLNIPAKTDNISFHTDVEDALAARSEPLPKLGPFDSSKVWRNQLKKFSDQGFEDLMIERQSLPISISKSQFTCVPRLGIFPFFSF